MVGPASTETQERPVGADNDKIVHLPKQETDWRNGIVQHIQSMPEMGTSFTTEHATPDTAKHVPDSEALREVEAERVGALEPEFSGEDAKNIVDMIGNKFTGDKGPLAEARIVPGGKIVSFIKEKARLLKRNTDREMEKAA